MAYSKQEKIKSGEILKAEYLQNMEDGIIESFSKQRMLTSSDNLDDIRTAGEYCWSYAAGGVPVNAPVDNSTMTMSVFVTDSGTGAAYKETICQFVKSSKYGVFIRNSSRNSGNFDTWLRLDNSSSSSSSGSGSLSYYERKALLLGEQWTKTFTIAGATYPNYGGQSTGYIAQGSSNKGIIYSSTFRDGTDVLWNFNPSTYYSAVANPASLLYTVDNRFRSPNVFNEAAYMGSVCSTTALKACGYVYPWDTSEIRAAWKEKTNHHIDNLEVGDILWRQGHVAGILAVNVGSDGHVTSVLVIEQAGRVVIFEKTADEWDSYFPEWTTIYRREDLMDKTLELPVVFPENHSIIYEGGNNTYVDDYSKMLFYIPTATKVFLTTGGTTTEYEKSNFPTETVNDITVYDLASLFTGVGDYYLHTDENTTDICIKIINKGTVTISGSKATLSGYDNCKPHGYRVIEILTENSSNYNFWNAPEGYTSKHVLNSFEDITSDTFDIHNIPASGKYKLEVFYDTDYGWARLLSEDIL